jgi:hypothetical protein
LCTHVPPTRQRHPDTVVIRPMASGKPHWILSTRSRRQQTQPECPAAAAFGSAGASPSQRGTSNALTTIRPLPSKVFFRGLPCQKITNTRTPHHDRADHSTYSHFLTTEETQPVVSRWKNSPSLTVGRSGRPL